MNHFGQLRDIFESDLGLIRSWRNSPNVRSNMYTRHEISAQEHQLWWERIKKDDSQKHFIYEIDNSPSGVVGFMCIDKVNLNCDWAFYASPGATRGTGIRMELLALDYAFKELGLHKLCCEVLGFNSSVVKMHKKFGFRVEGIRREQHKVEHELVDVYHLGLLSSEWEEQRPAIKKILNKLMKVEL